ASSILPAKGSLRLPHAPAHYSLARPNLLASSTEVNLMATLGTARAKNPRKNPNPKHSLSKNAFGSAPTSCTCSGETNPARISLPGSKPKKKSAAPKNKPTTNAEAAGITPKSASTPAFLQVCISPSLDPKVTIFYTRAPGGTQLMRNLTNLLLGVLTFAALPVIGQAQETAKPAAKPTTRKAVLRSASELK